MSIDQAVEMQEVASVAAELALENALLRRRLAVAEREVVALRQELAGSYAPLPGTG